MWFSLLSYKFTDQDSLDQAYADYEDLSEVPNFVEDNFRNGFEETKRHVIELSAATPGLLEFFKIQSHFYTLWGYLTTEKARLLPPDQFAPRYLKFLSDVAGLIEQLRGDEDLSTYSAEAAEQRAVISYALNARGASTDLSPRKIRHDALVTAMHGAEAVGHEDS